MRLPKAYGPHADFHAQASYFPFASMQTNARHTQGSVSGHISEARCRLSEAPFRATRINYAPTQLR